MGFSFEKRVLEKRMKNVTTDLDWFCFKASSFGSKTD